MNALKLTTYGLLFAYLAGGLTGCQAFRGPSGILERQADTAGLTTGELRSIMDDLVIQCASRIELAADQIIEATDRSDVHKNALLWKSNGISSCFQAATGRDPLAAFMNIWILNKQTLGLFEQSDKPPEFGDQQSIAIDTTLQLEAAFDQVLAKIGKEFPIGESFATRFAADFPIQNLYFDRASIAEHYTDYIEKINIGKRDIKQVVGNIDGQIDQFQKLSAMYAEFLPKQARWQAELLALETIPPKAISTMLSDLNSATESARQVADVVDQIPNLVERERVALKRTVTEERVATMNAVATLQAETVSDLRDERRVVMDELKKERVAILDELKKERATIMHSVQGERIAATRDISKMSQNLFDQMNIAADQKIDLVTDQGIRLTDYVFERVAQLGFVLVALLAISFWFFRRQDPPQPQTVEVPETLSWQSDSISNAPVSQRAA